jgi:hypothetical protein
MLMIYLNPATEYVITRHLVEPPDALATSCKARLVMFALKLPDGPRFGSSMARSGGGGALHRSVVARSVSARRHVLEEQVNLVRWARKPSRVSQQARS